MQTNPAIKTHSKNPAHSSVDPSPQPFIPKGEEGAKERI